MGDFRRSLDKLADSFEGFAGEIRELADDLPQQGAAGAGEVADDAPVGRREYRDDGIDDDTVIKMRSGDLRKVVDAYRKLVRYARNGRIPTQDERFKLHQHVRNVKHLIRKPHR